MDETIDVPVVEIRKRVTGHAYARNGNAHNPTPRVCWEVWEVYESGRERLIDHAYRLTPLRKDYPRAALAKARSSRGGK